MRGSHWVSLIVAVSVAFSVGCYPTLQQHSLEKADLPERYSVKAPTKIHLYDGSVILADSGFACLRDTIIAFGPRYSLRREEGIEKRWFIHIDSVAALEYYEMKARDPRPIGSLLLGATVTAEVAVGAVALFKIIFGSCPTVYSSCGEQEYLEAECFSYSIGSKLEAGDLDRLSHACTTGESLTLCLKNEALETHYINVLKLHYVDHPPGTEAFPTGEGEVFVAQDLVYPLSAVNSEGSDVLPLVRSRDELAYEADSAAVTRMFSRGTRDWIECSVPVPRNSSEARLLLKLKNSLESTVLVYDVMMRDQGLAAVEWSRALNESWWYAWKLSRWYSELSGIQIEVMQRGRYVCRDKIPDTGPIAWKSVGARIPIWRCGDTLRVRLSFFPDNWIIDWIGFGFGGRTKARLKDAMLSRVQDQYGEDNEDWLRSLKRDDDLYAVTYPGDRLDISFKVPPVDNGERTYFLYSKGYYVEWVRGEWIREVRAPSELDLSRKRELTDRLSTAWVGKKNSFRELFLKHRIPARGPAER